MKMISRRFFIFWIFLWCSSFVTEVQCLYEALIFDRMNQQLTEINPTDHYSICYQCITACPADPNSEKETILNQYASLYGNGVFLRGVYNGDDENVTYVKNMETIICEQPLTPVIAWNAIEEMEIFEIGYELFYAKGEIDLPSNNYRHLTKLKVDGEPEGVAREPPNNNVITSQNNNEKYTFKINYLRGQSVFYWITVMWVDVLDDGITRLIDVHKDIVNDYSYFALSITSCNDYYSANGKIETHEGSNFPSHRTNLIKTQIVPMLMFHSLSARLATCTYLNIAFIFEDIANSRLKKVDLYLYSIYREWPTATFITFGINGESAEYDENELNKLYASENELFKKFPVPEVIFRIIEHHFEGIIFNAIIIIHNNRENVPREDQICQNWAPGWDDITATSSTSTSGLTYVCPMSQAVVDKLGLGREVSSIEATTGRIIFALSGAVQPSKYSHYAEDNCFNAAAFGSVIFANTIFICLCLPVPLIVRRI